MFIHLGYNIFRWLVFVISSYKESDIRSLRFRWCISLTTMNVIIWNLHLRWRTSLETTNFVPLNLHCRHRSCNFENLFFLRWFWGSSTLGDLDANEILRFMYVFSCPKMGTNVPLWNIKGHIDRWFELYNLH